MRLPLIFVLLGVAAFMLAAPASASHIRGGAITASTTASGHLTGTIIYSQSGDSGATVSVSFSVINPGSTSQSTTTTLNRVRTLPGIVTYQGPYDVDLAALFGSAPDGVYTARFSRSAFVGGITNSSASGVDVRAGCQLVAGQANNGVVLNYVPLTNFSIGGAFAQNVNATGTGALAYSSLAGQSGFQTTDVATIDNTGLITIPAATASTFTAGQFIQYGFQVTDASGGFVQTTVVMKATANVPPVIGALASPYQVAPGSTQAINVTATDPDGTQTVTFFPGTLPPWITFSQTPGNPAQGTFPVSPPANEPLGTTTFNLEAIDDSTEPLGDSKPISVELVNPQPNQESVNVTQQASVQSTGGPGATVSGGSYTASNTSNIPYTLTSSVVAFSDPSLFSSATLTATAGGVTVSATATPTASTTFTFNPPLTIPAGTNATLSLQVTFASLSASAPRSTAGIHLASLAWHPSSSGFLAGLGALLVVGLALASLRRETWARKAALTLCVLGLASGLYGCGGSGSANNGAYNAGFSATSTLTLTRLDATGSGQSVVFTGLPASLGTVTVQQ